LSLEKDNLEVPGTIALFPEQMISNSIEFLATLQNWASIYKVKVCKITNN
jgi:hypothetical protein